MAYAKHDGGSTVGYRLPGIWEYVTEKQIAMADAPDPRVYLAEEGPKRDALLAEDRLLALTRPGYRRGKAVYDIDRIEAGLPVLIRRTTIDTRPIAPGESPGRRAWPDARQWPEIRDRLANWFELHPDDRVVPVSGDVDPATYWQ